jgi:hypothetical protein
LNSPLFSPSPEANAAERDKNSAEKTAIYFDKLLKFIIFGIKNYDSPKSGANLHGISYKKKPLFALFKE